jgi:hypothetical protein
VHQARARTTQQAHSSTSPRKKKPQTKRYEDYLDAQVTPADMYHLEDAELARQLVELG